MQQAWSEAGIKDKALESACLATLMLMQCRRKGGGFCLGVAMGGDKVECADVELEKKSFVSLVREAQQLLQKKATGDQVDTKPEVVFALGRNTTNFSTMCSEVWTVREEEGNSGHIVVSGTSLEEEMSFQLCWQACAKTFETDVWQVPVFSASSLDRVREWGRAPLDLAPYSDSAGNLLPVPCLIAERAQNIQSEKRQQLGAVAVAGNDFQISYDELYRRTASVSQVLMQQADPKKSKAVLVCMGRGEAIAPTFLGILAAGFYVVPVDIYWPQDRILQVAEECNACLAFTEAESLKLLDGTSMKALVIDSSFYAHAKGPDEKKEPQELAEISSDQIAVILFTSGSSGKPKGILLSGAQPVTFCACFVVVAVVVVVVVAIVVVVVAVAVAVLHLSQPIVRLTELILVAGSVSCFECPPKACSSVITQESSDAQHVLFLMVFSFSCFTMPDWFSKELWLKEQMTMYVLSKATPQILLRFADLRPPLLPTN
jgi:hypothetical protein